MRAFVYARYSCTNQKEISIEGQIRECEEYAAKNGIDIIARYADRAKSARTDSRADFRRLFRDIETHAADIVLVYKLDRFFRNRAESALYRMRLEENGMRLVSATEPIPQGSAGIITEGMIETVSEYFSAKLSEDVSRGMYDTAKNCRVTSSLPLGFRIGEDHKYHIDPVGAEIVQKIFESYDAGLTLAEISRRLNAAGYRTGANRAFTVQAFYFILRNPKYIGIYTYGSDIRIEGGCPRIIDDELFFRVQRKLEKNRHRPGAYTSKTEYLLSGKIFCGQCGTHMDGICGTSRTKDLHYYYACSAHRKKHCEKKNVRKEAIEETVISSTLDLLTDENIAMIAREVEKYSIAQSESDDLSRSLCQQLAEVEQKIKNIGKAISMGIITETTKQLLEDAEADRESLRRQIGVAKARAALTIRAEQVACWLDGFRRGDRSDPDFRRQIISALVSSVYVYDDHLKIIFNIDKNNTVSVPYNILSEFDHGLKRGTKLVKVEPSETVFFLCGTFGLLVPKLSRW